jgi:GTP cyclohydrolase II
MPESRTLFGPSLQTDLVKVERAIAEFRAGRPVLLRNGERLALALSAELTDDEMARRFDMLAQGRGHLVLRPGRDHRRQA